MLIGCLPCSWQCYSVAFAMPPHPAASSSVVVPDHLSNPIVPDHLPWCYKTPPLLRVLAAFGSVSMNNQEIIRQRINCDMRNM